MDCPEAREYLKRFSSRFHRIKIFWENITIASDTIICPDRIYMVAYGEKDLSATEIRNPSLAQTQKVLFEELWKSF